MLTLVLCLSAVLWNDPFFVVHFFVPNDAWLVVDGLLKDQFYAVSGFCILAFLFGAPTDLDVILAVLFFAAFGLVKGMDNVVHPSNSTERFARFRTIVMAGFAIVHAIISVVVIYRAYRQPPCLGFSTIRNLFEGYLSIWVVFLIVGNVPAIKRPCLEVLLSSVTVNSFVAAVNGHR
jgi:hypothetical protein